MKNKKIEKLSAEDREKYIVFSRMNKVKIIMLVFLIVSVIMFIIGGVLKNGLCLILGAVFITLFFIFALIHSYMKSVWERLMRQARDKKKDKK